MKNEKIGIGIVTYNRPEQFKKCYNSLPFDQIDQIIIVNDGEAFEFEDLNLLRHKNIDLITHEKNMGVAISKNDILSRLIEQQCDHIFLIEDDIFIKDFKVFERYIEASKITGIQHFNFSQHGMMNKKWPDGIPNPEKIIDYGDLKISLYQHCVGSFSYYSNKCLQEVGLMDEDFYNAWEHVDHTYKIIKHGMHPPFWYFADIENSWEYLGDEEWSFEQSSIFSNPKREIISKNADEVFLRKNGLSPLQIPQESLIEVGSQLKQIKKDYGTK